MITKGSKSKKANLEQFKSVFEFIRTEMVSTNLNKKELESEHKIYLAKSIKK